jgi:YHS domain-containing protein
MQRDDGMRRFGPRGSAGLLATLLAVSTAEAALPTGGMLLPRPRGPARADLPACTAIDVHRVPSKLAYGIGDTPGALVGGRDAAEGFAEHHNRPAAVDPNAVGGRRMPGEPRRVAAVGEPNPFGPPDTAVPALGRFEAITADGILSVEGATASTPQTDATYGGLKNVCPVTLREEQRVVPPQPHLFSIYAGRRYEFATPEAKAAFDAAPAYYAPALGGRDVVLTADGSVEALGTLRYAGVYRERLYLFQSEETCKRFYENPVRFAVGE